jgi:hypothetical protein
MILMSPTTGQIPQNRYILGCTHHGSQLAQDTVMKTPLRALAGTLATLALIACGSDTGASPAPALPLPSVTPDLTLRQVEVQDVSIIYPLPATSAQATDLVSGATVAGFGELVPKDAFAMLPGPIDERSTGAAGKVGEEARIGFRLVGVRVDPCFGVLGATDCPNQIRLIFQGLNESPDGQLGAADGAIHVFYDVPRDSLMRFVRQVLTLRAQNGTFEKAPLGVHPILAKQGLAGQFAQGLRSVILEHTGASRVSRMTFFTRSNSRTATWGFGMLNRTGASFELGPIATLAGEKKQGFVTKVGEGLNGSATGTSHSDNLSLLLETAKADTATPAERQFAFDAALRIENPARHSPDTIDCVSCHVATTVVEDAAKRWMLGDLNRVGFEPKPKFDGASSTLGNLHAMSYDERKLGITQRTANETEVVVQAVTKLLQ